MLSTRRRAACLAGLAAVLPGALLLGCSPGGPKATTVAPAPSAEQPAAQPGDSPIGISPGGVTTRIDEPAQSTEEQYAQACLSAKEWMDAKGGDPHSLIEPYLKDIQASTQSGRATFMKSWPELSNAEQAAVIIAVQAAADGGC